MSGLPSVRSPAWNDVPWTWRVMARATVLTLSVLLVCTTLGFAARRIWLFEPLAPAPIEWLAGGAAGLVLLAAALRRLWIDTRPPRDVERRSAGDWWVHGASSISVLAGGLTLASLAAGRGGSLVLALLVVAVEAWVGWFFGVRDLRRRGTTPAVAVAPAEPNVSAEVLRAESDDEPPDDELLFDEEESAWQPPGVTQQFTRGIDATRGEYVLGMLYVDFAPGQRSETLHVAFCPPLRQSPGIALQQLDGPPASATVGQAEAFGARFEVRLAQSWEEPQRVVLQFETQG